MAIKNLNILLKSMNPEIVKGEFAFCKIPDDKTKYFIFSAKCIFKEKEATTLIIEKNIADKLNLSYISTWAQITLNVNSDLNAIGFLAKITEALAKNKISVNAISAYHHDHLFVPYKKSKKALQILKSLIKKASRTKTHLRQTL